MPVFDTYTQGTPNWVELMTPDQRGAAEFYGALFGWEMVENPLDDGHFYIVGNVQGDAVAGITFQLPELEGHPAFWNVFLAADDVDAVAARVGPAGGIVEAEPFDFFDYGRTARIQDPTGARVSLWQPRTMRTVRANEPGTPIWNELLTPDIGRATQFYADVLGVSADTHPVPWANVPTYTTFSSGGRPIAGAVRADGGGAAALERLLQRRRRRRGRGPGRRPGRQADRAAVRPRGHRPDGLPHRPPRGAVLPDGQLNPAAG